MLSVGSPEDGFAVSVVFDRPSVLMEEPVVVTAEEDQIVQIGGSSIGPMCLVMGVEPTFERTSGPPAVPVPMPELVTQPGWDQPGTTTDPQHFPCGRRWCIPRSDHRTSRRAVSLAMTGPPFDLGHPGRLRVLESMLRDQREPRFQLELNCSHHRWWNRVRPDRRPSAADTDRTILIRDSPVFRPLSLGSLIPPGPGRDRADRREDCL